MKKKLLIALVLVAVVMCLFTITALAVEVDGVYYTIDTNNKVATVSTENRTSTTQIVTIPSTFEYEGATYRVTSISNDAFYGNKTVKELRILSEYITKIPSSMIASTNGGALEKIYIDFSNITSIGGAGLNPSSQTNGNNPVANSFYYYDAKAFIENGKDVVITEPDFSNCTSIGAAAFQGANFKKITIPAAVYLNNQMFRKSTIEELIIEGENRTDISYYAFSECKQLKKITIKSKNLKSVSNDLFSGCTAVEEIHIDMSKCEAINSVAFQFAEKYDSGNTTVQWYNLEGEKIVDLSSMKNFYDKALCSSNIGSATIIWPRAIEKLEDQVFRKCNINQPLYINPAEGKTITIPFWCMNGNKFTFAYFGKGVKTVSSCFETNCIVVCAEDSVNFTHEKVFDQTTGNAIYCKSYTGTDVSSRAKVYNIASATSAKYGLCGFIATVKFTDETTQEFNYAIHNYEGVADETVCPAGSLMVYTCTGCASSYEEKLENFIGGTHDFVIENGATVVKIEYPSNNYFANGVVVIKCASCSAQNSETEISPLFEAVGYSSSEVVNGYISHTIKVKTETIKQYKNYTGITVQYGVMASVAASNPLTIENGKVVANGKAVSAEMSNTNYTTLLIKIHGITSNEAMNCNAYVAIDGKITYLCGDEALNSPTEKSLAISNDTVEQTNVKAILQETKQYA